MPTQTKQPTPTVQLIPLGGEQEIGKNTWVFRCEDDIILLDAGLGFPDASMHGINIVLPDMTYLKQNRDKIRGMVVTHGHEDHIGGIPYHLKEFDIPIIYGPKLALSLLADKLKEAGVSNRTELRTVEPRDLVPLGKNFFAEFIRNTHSFADSFTVALHTPAGVIIQTGDFKVDHTPVDGESFDFQRLAEHGEKGVLCLISDSTNAEVPGFTPSEAAVRPGLEKAFAGAEGRVLVTTFASSVHRINLILQTAEKFGRVVSLVGRSMLNVVAHARRLGYIKCKDETLQPMHVINQLPDSEVTILSTGSQGEPLSAMTRISNNAHSQVKIKSGDTVVFSATPIPGNTIPVVRTIDRLVAMGARVVYGKQAGLHVSGHGCQEDQKLMLALTKPKFFVPTHGEYRMLVQHAKTGMSMGIPEENIVIVDNGDVVEVTPDSIQATGKVPSGLLMIDRNAADPVAAKVMQERQNIATDGLVAVAFTVSGSGQLVHEPDVNLVAISGNSKTVPKLVRQTIQDVLDSEWSQFARSLEKGTLDVDWVGLKDSVERGLRSLLRDVVRGRPLLVVMMQNPDSGEVPSSAKAASVKQTQDSEVTTKPSRGRKKRRSTAAVAS
ncbi:MAG: ribonuclease J [Cyanobacteria bacterium P01_F01_bin.33]